MNTCSILAILFVSAHAQYNLRGAHKQSAAVAAADESSAAWMSSEGRTMQEWQEGVARTMLGAAYRVYRPNHGMHDGKNGESEKVKQYPYRFPNFLEFVKSEFVLVENMMTMAANRYDMKISLDEVTPLVEAMKEKVNTMEQEIENMPEKIFSCNEQPEDKQHQVMLDMIGGRVSVACIDPNFFQEYLTVVLKLATAGADIPTTPEAQLQWFEKYDSEFKNFATDVYNKKDELKAKAGEPEVDLVIRSYHLARSFLTSPQKLRERDGSRTINDLSRYIPFLDATLGTSYTDKAQMNSSSPYYYGYALWGKMQTYAEAVAKSPEDDLNKQYIEDFFNWFNSFKHVHPCPFCMHHLNSEVQFTREVDMYNLEYTFYNLPEDAEACVDPNRSVNGHWQVDLTKKIQKVLDDSTGQQLKIYLWVMHNAVSSSIGRSEVWHPSPQQVKDGNRKEECDVEYTLRWWSKTDLRIEFAQLEQHRATVLALFEGIDAAAPKQNVHCKTIGQDPQVLEIKAAVDEMLEKHTDTILKHLEKSYGLVPADEKRITRTRNEYQLSAVDDLQSCRFEITDPLDLLNQVVRL